jgi:hypothetical protein
MAEVNFHSSLNIGDWVYVNRRHPESCGKIGKVEGLLFSLEWGVLLVEISYGCEDCGGYTPHYHARNHVSPIKIPNSVPSSLLPNK